MSRGQFSILVIQSPGDEGEWVDYKGLGDRVHGNVRT